MALSKTINEAELKTSTGADLRQDMALMVGHKADWANFLVHTPMCISLLGELMYIATATDFTLDKNAPKNRFNWLKWPNSFRASLVQVSNTGYEAFDAANKSMDQIRLLTADVPQHLKEAVTILLRGSKEEVKHMLPIPLNAIKHTAKQCLRKAKTVEKKYKLMMLLTAELLSASTSAKGGYEDELKETEAALTFVKFQENIAAEEKEMAKQSYVEIEKTIKKAEDSYYKAMDAMPSGWNLIGMSVVESLSNGVASALDGYFNNSRLAVAGKVMTALLEKGKSSNAEEVPRHVGQSMSSGKIDVYSLAIKIQPFTSLLASRCVENGRLKKSLQQYDDDILQIKLNIDNHLQEAKDIATENNAVKDRVVELCNEGVNLCVEVRGMSKAIQTDDEKAKALAEKIINLKEAFISLSSECKKRLNSNPTATMGPKQRVMIMKVNEDASATQKVVQSARFKIEQSSAMLESTKEEYHKACDKKIETSKKYGEILGKIKKLDMTKLDFEKTSETLILGIRELGKLRAEWAQIVMFFSKMSNYIECSLDVCMEKFLKYTEAAQKLSWDEYPVQDFHRDIIYQLVFQSAKVAYIVNMISDTYVEVSQTYLMGKMAGLGGMLGYDPETQGTELENALQQLRQDMHIAQTEIGKLVKKRIDEFDRQIESRKHKIQSQLEEAMPVDSSSSQEKKRIQEAVQLGMERAKQETQGELTASEISVDDFL